MLKSAGLESRETKEARAELAAARPPLLLPAGLRPGRATTTVRKQGLGRRQAAAPPCRVTSDPGAQAHPEARALNRYYVPGRLASHSWERRSHARSQL